MLTGHVFVSVDIGNIPDNDYRDVSVMMVAENNWILSLAS
jgi:hypothetical protein